MTIPFDSDASRAAVTVAAQRIAAYADRQGISIEPAQCEELAESLMHVYQAFLAGTRYALASTTATANPDPKTQPPPVEAV